MSNGRKQSRSSPPKVDAGTQILVLHGKEQMLKRVYLQQLREALEQTHGEIESFTYDGRLVELAEVLDELRGYSLMQRYKLVIVEDADTFVKNNRQALERYAQQPVDHATLVLRAGTWNKGNLDKYIAKVGAVISCDALNEKDALPWLANRAKSWYGRPLDREAAQVMIERLGTDLSLLDSELSKIALLGEADEPIQQATVKELVGRSSDEQAWAAQEALLHAIQTGSTDQALRTIRELIDLAGQPEPLVMYFVADLFRKLSVASMLQRAGWQDSQITKHLKVFGPRQRLFLGVLKRFDRDRITSLYDQALQLDSRAKSGLGEPEANHERFCVSLGMQPQTQGLVRG